MGAASCDLEKRSNPDFQFIVVIFVLYFLGYVLGPSLTPFLVKERVAEKDQIVTVEYRGARYDIKLAEFRDDALPQLVKITKATSLPKPSGEGKVLLKKGEVVTLLNRAEGGLIVEKINAKAKGTIKAGDTDLFLQLAQQIYEKEAGRESTGLAVNSKTPDSKPESAPKPEPESAPAPKPAPKAEAEPEPEPEPKAVAVVPPTPAAARSLTDEEIIALMKKSIQGGAVEEFGFDQVKGWKANGEELIDGTNYQTGLAAYEAATIFGVRPVQAKALIKDGKIERWVFAKSGMEIR